ncbi:conserved hypothetical protein, partial [Ricinus communis]
AGLGERVLGILDGSVLDEGRIVRFAPDAVIDGRDFDRTDLVFIEADRRLQRRCGKGLRDEFELRRQAEGCRSYGRAEHGAAGHVKHRNISSGLWLSGQAEVASDRGHPLRKKIDGDGPLFPATPRILASD